jgi:lipopolysaccharide/colanic/teichoic acid biosynthesis glycosyltransferase
LIHCHRAAGDTQQHLSRWAQSPAKRLFDLTCVLCSLPLALPLFFLIAIAVSLTSRGPVLFHQQRVGRGSRTFTIYKFRTMPVDDDTCSRPALTTAANQTFTPIGPFLRRWKLDELPQLFNVLRGDMSLVGPRPKLPHLHAGHLACRPGITGRATLVFACEEVALSSIPNEAVDLYYRSVVRPLKQRLDDEYMARATFVSDLRLILASIFRRWDNAQINGLLPYRTDEAL